MVGHDSAVSGSRGRRTFRDNGGGGVGTVDAAVVGRRDSTMTRSRRGGGVRKEVRIGHRSTTTKLARRNGGQRRPSATRRRSAERRRRRRSAERKKRRRRRRTRRRSSTSSAWQRASCWRSHHALIPRSHHRLVDKIFFVVFARQRRHRRPIVVRLLLRSILTIVRHRPSRLHRRRRSQKMIVPHRQVSERAVRCAPRAAHHLCSSVSSLSLSRSFVCEGCLRWLYVDLLTTTRSGREHILRSERDDELPADCLVC